MPAIDAPAVSKMAARFRRAWLVWARIPSGAVPVGGSIHAVPGQNTKPPAMIASL